MQTGPVAVDTRWSVSLGAAAPIPKDTGYAIVATVPGGAADSVNDITSTDKPLIEITEIDSEPLPAPEDMRFLTIYGQVKENPPFNTIGVIVYLHDQQNRAVAVSIGWIKPVPVKLKWKIKLKAPKNGHLVVHALGIKTLANNTGEVIARFMKAVD